MLNKIRDHLLAFKWLDGAPMFFTLVLFSSVIIFTNGYFLISSLILGTIAAAVVDVKNNFLTRLKQYSFALIAFIISTILVYLSSESWVLLTLVFAIYSFVWLMLGSISNEIEKLGTASLLFYAYSIFTFFSLNQSITHKIIFLAIILIGSITYMVFSLLIYAIYPNQASHIYLSKVYKILSQLLNAKSDFFNPDQIDNLEVVREKYNRIRNDLNNDLRDAKKIFLNRLGRNINYNTSLLKYYYIAESISQHLDLYYVDYAHLTKILKHQDILFRFQRLYVIMSQDVEKIAQNIQNFSKPNSNPRREKSLNILQKSIDTYRQLILKRRSTSLELFELDKLYNDTSTIANKLNKLITMSAKEISTSENFDHNPIIETYREYNSYTSLGKKIIDKIKILLSNFSIKSSIFRNALRVSVVILITSNLYYFTNISFTMWAVMAATLVSKANYITTRTNIRRRIVGAIIGNFAGLILLLFSPSPITLLFMLVIAITTYAYCRLNNMVSIAIGLITFVIFLSLELYNTQLSIDIIGSRFAGNLVGILISFVATLYLLPNWNYEDTETILNKSFKTITSYFRNITIDVINKQEQGEVITNSRGMPIHYKSYTDAYNDNLKLHNSVHLMAQDQVHYANVIPSYTKFVVAHDNLLHMINMLAYHLQKLNYDNKERTAVLLSNLDKLSNLIHHFTSTSEKTFNDSIQLILDQYTKSNNFLNGQEEQDVNDQDINIILIENNLYLLAQTIKNYTHIYREAIYTANKDRSYKSIIK